MLLDQRAAHPLVGAPVPVAPHQHVTVDVMSCELVCGQIDPASLQVFVDIAEKVGELKGFPECRGVRRGFVTRADGAEHRQQLQSDHFGGAVHVSVQRAAIGIVGDGEVHPHRAEEVVE